MATGFSRTIDIGSDETFDFICSPCERRNSKTVQAVHFCSDCNELYCQTCLEFHASFPGLKDHKVLGRNQVKSWGKRKKTSASVPTEPCSEHQGEVVQMFCGRHNEICCHVCVSLEHRSCGNMIYIPKVAAGIAQSKELQETNTNLDQVTSAIGELKTTREDNKAKLDKSRRDALESLKDFRKQVNKMFDALEKKATDDIEKLHGDSHKDIMADITTCANFIAELTQLKQQLKSAGNNESQVFINMKKCQKKVSEGEQLIQNASEKQRIENLEFTTDPSLQSFLSSMQSLGKLEVKTTCPKATVQSLLYKVQNKRDITVRIRSDKTICRISGSCQMPDSSILLVDNYNQKLKHLDTSYSIIDHCDFTDRPISVCCISQSEAVVSSNKTIHFVSVDSKKMAVTRSIKMNHACEGMGYNNGQLYISDLCNNFYIYNTSGTCLQTLDIDNHGVKMFSNTHNIAVSPDGTRIYVADEDKGLVTLDNKGQLLSTFCDRDLRGAVGVCVDGRGSVFVSGWDSHNVMQLDKTGTQKIGVVITLGSDEWPRSVLIDKAQSKMMIAIIKKQVSTWCCDTVRVCDLQ